MEEEIVYSGPAAPVCKKMAVRKWICPKCGTLHDRDVNAQQNIYKIGAKILQDEGIQVIGLPATNKSAN